jgi:hypothetical protein
MADSSAALQVGRLVVLMQHALDEAFRSFQP